MKIIYYCATGTHSSLICAAIHLGLLPKGRRPSLKNIFNLPGFDGLKPEEIGRPYYLGHDLGGNQVYSLGINKDKDLVPKAIHSFLDTYQIPKGEYRLISTVDDGWGIQVGYVLSQYLGFSSLGRQLSARILGKNYARYVKLVDQVKRELTFPTG